MLLIHLFFGTSRHPAIQQIANIKPVHLSSHIPWEKLGSHRPSYCCGSHRKHWGNYIINKGSYLKRKLRQGGRGWEGKENVCPLGCLLLDLHLIAKEGIAVLTAWLYLTRDLFLSAAQEIQIWKNSMKSGSQLQSSRPSKVTAGSWAMTGCLANRW